MSRTWWAALAAARDLPEEELPTAPTPEGPPPPHRWAERDPAAAERLARARAVVAELAATHQMPPENLLTPDYLRRLAWEPPTPLTTETVSRTLAALGARPWQVELTVAPLVNVWTAQIGRAHV